MNLAIFACKVAERLNVDPDINPYNAYRAVWGELQSKSHKYSWNWWEKHDRAKDLSDTYFSLEKCPEDAPRLLLSSDKFIAPIATLYFELVFNQIPEEAHVLR